MFSFRYNDGIHFKRSILNSNLNKNVRTTDVHHKFDHATKNPFSTFILKS